jgi:hypothetical protein
MAYEAYEEHLRPRRREAEQRPRHARQPVAEDDETFAPPAPVAVVAEEEFEEAGDGLRAALDEADGEGRSAEREREEERQERINNLARSVVEETHQADGEDVAREPTVAAPEPRHGLVEPRGANGRVETVGGVCVCLSHARSAPAGLFSASRRTRRARVGVAALIRVAPAERRVPPPRHRTHEQREQHGPDDR